jgi:hypothetical protein
MGPVTPITPIRKAIYTMALFGCATVKLLFAQPPGTNQQLVLAAQDLNNSVIISTSTDARTWTQSRTVMLNGAAVTSPVRPNISWDGTAYHLLWIDPNGHVQHAQSQDAQNWSQQTQPLLKDMPVDEFKFFAEGNNHYLALLRPPGGFEVYNIVRGNSGTYVGSQWANDAAIVFGNNKFVIAAAEPNPDTNHSPTRFTLYDSSDGSTWNQSTPFEAYDGAKNVTIGFGRVSSYLL